MLQQQNYFSWRTKLLCGNQEKKVLFKQKMFLLLNVLLKLHHEHHQQQNIEIAFMKKCVETTNLFYWGKHNVS